MRLELLTWGGGFDKEFCVHANLPSSRATARPLARAAAISHPVIRTRGGWHDPGGWPGLAARIELGGWCGSRVPDRKIRNDEARGSQTMKRLVATIEKAFPKATVVVTRGLAVHTGGSRIASFEGRERAEVESGRAVSRESRVAGE